MTTVRRSTRSSQVDDETTSVGEDNNEQTPNVKRTRTETSTPGTPSSATRMNRADEKAELAELNKRLEFYILKQRERDASQDGYQREISSLRHSHEKELAALQELHDNQLIIVRRSRDEEAEHVTKLEAEAKRRESEFASIQSQLAAEKRSRAQLESKYDQATKDLTYTQQQLFSHEDKAKANKLELDQAKKTIDSLNKQLNEARQRAEEATQRATSAETDLSDLREEHNILQHHSEDESQRLHHEIHKLSQAAGRNEVEIKKDFQAIMEQHFRERQKQYEADRAAGLAELKESYDDKILGYRSSLEIAGHDLEKEKSNAKKYQQLLSDAQARVHELVTQRDTQQRVIDDLELQLGQERVKENPIIAQKNEIIRKIKEAFKRKDEEFDDLMDVKIMLDMEIKAYRTLLESEEDRLGYKSPAKKRKRSRRDDVSSPQQQHDEEEDVAFSMEDLPNNVSSPAPGKAGKGTQYKTKHGVPSLLISGFDIDGQYITIRNNSTEIVALAGWKLRAKITGALFSFPDVRLRPGESFTVRTRQYQQQRDEEDKHDDGDSKHDDDSSSIIQSSARGKTAVWPSSVVWDVSGDEAQLINPAGVIVTVVEVIATGTVRSSSSSSTTTSSSSYTSSGLTSADSVYTQDTSSTTTDGEIGEGEGADKKCIVM